MRDSARCWRVAVLDPGVVARELAALSWVCLLACGEEFVRAAQVTVSPAADTFVNAGCPDNNNGASSTLFTGYDSLECGGVMRSFVRFNLPAGVLNARTAVSGVTLTMVTAGIGEGGAPPTTPPTACTEWLQAVGLDWTEGSGADALYPTIGQSCLTVGGGATWNYAKCSSAGWTISATVSGAAISPASISSPVTWSGSSTSNLALDVQGWIDNPLSNHGWRVLCTSENPQAFETVIQRFWSRESANPPSLTVTYDCKSGFEDSGGGFCSACTSSANAACAASQPGNACVDHGPPATTYFCTCDHPAYEPYGNPPFGCADRNFCIPDHCREHGDTQSSCTDLAAPQTGYFCTCSDGFLDRDGTCLAPLIFADDWESSDLCTNWSDASPSC